MPDQFTCPNCRHAHRFLAALAGQSMHCHGCGFVFRIPLVPLVRVESTHWPTDTRWLLRLASGRQFGPVRQETIQEWLREGRADADSLISPEESQGWFRITDIFSLPAPLAKPGQGFAVPAFSPGGSWQPAGEAATSPAAIIPAAGLLDYWEDCAEEQPRGRMRSILRHHQQVLKALDAEAARAAGLLRFKGAKLVWLQEDIQDPNPLDIEAATVSSWQGPQGSEFQCVIPWSRLGRLPHEFLSILPGRLASPVALRRAHEEAFDGGRWIGITGDERDVMALAAGISQEKLAEGIQWEWTSTNRIYQMVMVWGVQGIPLGPEKFAHLVQTAPRAESGAPAGLRWYLERQSAFWRYARRLHLPGAPGSPVLFSSCGARLLALAADRLRESPVA